MPIFSIRQLLDEKSPIEYQRRLAGEFLIFVLTRSKPWAHAKYWYNEWDLGKVPGEALSAPFRCNNYGTLPTPLCNRSMDSKSDLSNQFLNSSLP